MAKKVDTKKEVVEKYSKDDIAKICERAYFIWLHKSMPANTAMADWLQAEKELKKEGKIKQVYFSECRDLVKEVMMAKARMIKCPECQDEFELEEYLEAGDTTFCVSCDAEVKVTKLEPPQLEIVTATEEEADFDEAGGDGEEDF